MDKVQNEHDDVLVESPNENAPDSVNTVEFETSMGDRVIEPVVDMQFKELKDMLDFYRNMLILLVFR